LAMKKERIRKETVAERGREREKRGQGKRQ
jgi:hypothetical protein